jgi:hypothetical protein
VTALQVNKKRASAKTEALSFSKLDFDANTPELVRRDPWLVLGQKIGEDSHTMDDAQMLRVETDANFQFPRIEDVIDTFSRPCYTGGLCWVNTRTEPFSQQSGAIEIQ